MSDFDKEAERERLREKYGEDDEPSTAEEMSELLLKGATMTNAHCSQCGDPIFRYDGQEFCPTCKQPVEREDGATAQPSPDAGDDAPDESADGAQATDDEPVPGEHIEVTTPSDEATVRFGGDDSPAREDDAPAQTEASAQSDTSTQTDAQSSSNRQQSPRTRGSSGTAGNEPAPDHSSADRSPTSNHAQAADAAGTPADREAPPAPTRSDAGSDGQSASQPSTSADALGTARGRLARVVDRYAAAAEAADDPRTAREYLETARAAAEALDATQF